MAWMVSVGGVVGGMLWVFKGSAILLGHGQPDHAFEAAPLLFAVATLGLARLAPRGRARRVGTVLAVAAVLSCLVAAISSVRYGGVLGPDLGLGVLAMTVALVVVGWPLRRSDVGGLPFTLGVGTIPAVPVGGALSVINERLLEVPIVLIGLVWIVVGSDVPRRTSGRRWSHERGSDEAAGEPHHPGHR